MIAVKWIRQPGGISVGTRDAEVRSLSLPDEYGRRRRRRVTTCWDLDRPGFTRVPARGRLAREEGGRIGAFVSGRHEGRIKIGGHPGTHAGICVPLEALSARARRRLLSGTGLRVTSEDGQVFAREDAGPG